MPTIKLIAVIAAILLSGCAAKQATSQPLTAPVAGHLTKIGNDLSDIDAKVVSLQQLK